MRAFTIYFNNRNIKFCTTGNLIYHNIVIFPSIFVLTKFHKYNHKQKYEEKHIISNLCVNILIQKSIKLNTF